MQSSQIGTIFLANGAEVSPEGLASLVRRCREQKAEADEYGLLKFFREDALNAYMDGDTKKRCPRRPFLELFLSLGNATLAACRLDMCDRKARRWVEDFVEDLTRQLQSRARQNRDFEARQAECEERCGRQRISGVSSASRNNNRSIDHTREIPIMDIGGRCDSCPLRMARTG